MVLTKAFSLGIDDLEGSDNDYDDIPFHSDEIKQPENLLDEEQSIPTSEQAEELSNEINEIHMEAPKELTTSWDKSKIKSNYDENLLIEELFHKMDKLFD